MTNRIAANTCSTFHSEWVREGKEEKVLTFLCCITDLSRIPNVEHRMTPWRLGMELLIEIPSWLCQDVLR